MNRYLDLHPEVQTALKNKQPVVALESTIISHGMPYPRNVETAKRVEQIVRENGAIPATIAVLSGRLKAGLTPDELEHLAKSGSVAKVSRRDLPYIVSGKKDGATTVASTMIIAALAGIKIFVTGGIGGVHRGAGESFDVSADLTELANTNVAVVCAGAKSILDIGSTLEVLETMGVPVYGYQTDEFPAFYTRKSGFSVDYRVENTTLLAETLKIKWELGLNGGVVIGNPIPEEHAIDEQVIKTATDTALQEADSKGIKGKEITPFLLARITELTGEKSLAANIQLVFNNAKIGAQLSVALSKIE
ncbi:pseudouridine-5'-phosphate glycosidase [bacterium]|nr:pseudouridine-5'-phosphate glycosidase [bacterium]